MLYIYLTIIIIFLQAAKKAGMKDDIIKKALKRSKDKDVADRLQAFADEARANGVGYTYTNEEASVKLIGNKSMIDWTLVPGKEKWQVRHWLMGNETPDETLAYGESINADEALTG